MTFKEFVYLLDGGECPLCSTPLSLDTGEISYGDISNTVEVKISLQYWTRKSHLDKFPHEASYVIFGFDEKTVNVIGKENLALFNTFILIHVECTHCRQYSYSTRVPLANDMQYPNLQPYTEFIEIEHDGRLVEVSSNLQMNKTFVNVNKRIRTTNAVIQGVNTTIPIRYDHDFSFEVPLMSFIKKTNPDFERLCKRIKKLAPMS